MRKRMRARRNSSSMLSLYARVRPALSILLAGTLWRRETFLELVCGVRAVSQVHDRLARLGLEQQGVGNAAEGFLRRLHVGPGEGIAAQGLEALDGFGQSSS